MSKNTPASPVYFILVVFFSYLRGNGDIYWGKAGDVWEMPHRIKILKRDMPLVAGAAFSIALLVTSLTVQAIANVFVSTETESATIASPAATVADASAASGSAVRFGAAGAFQANCINVPSACGYPDATNTGVPAGTTLTNSGCVTVNTNDATVQNLHITDCNITVNANNVTIKNVKISGCTYYPIDYSGHTGLVVQDTEIDSNCEQTTAGMSFDNYTAIRMHVHGSADGFKADSNAVIQDSYIHDLWVTADSHNDGVQTTGGSNVTLTHNTIDTDSQGVCVQFGPSDTDWMVTNNLFHCTGWSLNGSSGTANSSFLNNRFARVAGWYGPSGLGESQNITWSGNYFDDTGAVVSQ